MSMAAGEYVSVSSQSDTEQADIARETLELASQPEREREELQQIYIKRGLDAALALQVADQLMAKDALAAHALDELGISHVTAAKPVQAALTSALTFAVGAAMPLLMVLVSPSQYLVPAVSIASLLFLALLGRHWSTCRRCKCLESNGTRYFLGRFGHGRDSWHRLAVWHCCLTVSQTRTAFLAGTEKCGQPLMHPPGDWRVRSKRPPALLPYFNRPTCLSQATISSAAASGVRDVVSMRSSGFSGAS